MDTPQKLSTRLLASPRGGVILLFLAGLIVFGSVSGTRLTRPSPNNHYVHLALNMLEGRLSLPGEPPHRNDWARYDGRWYVSFPPLPAALMIPGVALFGLEFNDRLFTLIFAAAGPALLFLLLTALTREHRFSRSARECLLLSGLYGVGTVYFFSAVQGSVWYTAHMVGGVFLLLFLISMLNGARPLLAGAMLALAFACRPPMILGAPLFAYELLRPRDPRNDTRGLSLQTLTESIQRVGPRYLARQLLLFALPIAVVLSAMLALNWTRFDNPLEFGHGHLVVRWSERIEKWGLFDFHFLAKNLAASLALLPWLGTQEPYLQISRHGLAIWFTTPALFYVLAPNKKAPFSLAVGLTALLIATPSLLYQNTGWVQFGYRFSLDYMPLLFVLLAAGERRFGRLFTALGIFALVVNLFGAITFDRFHEFYPTVHATELFQPD